MDKQGQMLSASEIKQELLDMMLVLDEFLKENGIPYTIAYGTLLGAVRHKGFIPWDDDVDIGMLRGDYERLVAVLRENNSIGGKLYGAGCELGNANWPFLKIETPYVAVLENSDGVVVENQHLWIDVFPYDYLPDHMRVLHFKYVRLLRKLKFLKQLHTSGYVEGLEGFSRAKASFTRFALAPFSDLFFSKAIVKACRRLDSKRKEVGDILWGISSVYECYPDSIFSEMQDYEFEGHRFSGVKDYDEFLGQYYGNYMELPPVEKRKGHDIMAWRKGL